VFKNTKFFFDFFRVELVLVEIRHGPPQSSPQALLNGVYLQFKDSFLV
jgi:hypothetical protein